MRAVALNFANRTLDLVDAPEPQALGPKDVLFRVHEGGICGTDRELANFVFGYPPEGESYLVLGHEAVGQVVEAGSQSSVRVGDWVAPMVRRPCSPACASCARDRRDLCLTLRYTERGIFGAHGYLTNFAVDHEDDLVRIDSKNAEYGVLAEPLSVVEKAVETALRLHPGKPEESLVLGAGTIGILAALLLKRRGLNVSVHSLEPAGSPRARLAEMSGARYLSALEGKYDIIVEAAGSDEKASEAVSYLGPLGVMVLLGARQSTRALDLLAMIVKNQTITGSVNAGPEHFRRAAAELGELDGAVLRRLIHRVALTEYRSSILGTMSADKPKIVHMLE